MERAEIYTYLYLKREESFWNSLVLISLYCFVFCIKVWAPREGKFRERGRSYKTSREPHGVSEIIPSKRDQEK